MLSENVEEVTQPDGTVVPMHVETHFQMNYTNGEWKRIKKNRRYATEESTSTTAASAQTATAAASNWNIEDRVFWGKKACNESVTMTVPKSIFSCLQIASPFSACSSFIWTIIHANIEVKLLEKSSKFKWLIQIVNIEHGQNEEAARMLTKEQNCMMLYYYFYV